MFFNLRRRHREQRQEQGLPDFRIINIECKKILTWIWILHKKSILNILKLHDTEVDALGASGEFGPLASLTSISTRSPATCNHKKSNNKKTNPRRKKARIYYYIIFKTIELRKNHMIFIEPLLRRSNSLVNRWNGRSNQTLI